MGAAVEDLEAKVIGWPEVMLVPVYLVAGILTGAALQWWIAIAPRHEKDLRRRMRDLIVVMIVVIILVGALMETLARMRGGQ